MEFTISVIILTGLIAAYETKSKKKRDNNMNALHDMRRSAQAFCNSRRKRA